MDAGLALKLTSVAFRYRARSEFVLNDVSVSIPFGTLTAITGSSGSGKTTLLYLCGLLLSPSAGRINFAGTEVAQHSDSERAAIRARRIGFVFQDAMLDPTRSVLDNVVEGGLYAREWTKDQLQEPARDLLERFGVAAQQSSRCAQISGGQAQRVGICRALVCAPDLLLADEPTGNLDSENERIVLESLLAEAHDHGRAVIVATHSAMVADACDAVIRVDQGHAHCASSLR